MRGALASLLLLMSGALPSQAQTFHREEGDKDSPLVRECVDELVIVRTPTSEFARVVFWKNGHLLTTRCLLEDMVWTTDDGKFQLVWEDYYAADRIVEAERFSVWVVEDDKFLTDSAWLQWWNQGRNMRDLRQP